MLPAFRYHPNPIATGNVKPSDTMCACCGSKRGYIYTASIYSRECPKDSLCPWCIADGSAAKKFNAVYCDDEPLAQAGLPDSVIDEVTTRTPSYNSWQQQVWLCCCNDACAFYGDAPAEELKALTGETLLKTLNDLGWKETNWRQFIQSYRTGGNPAVYKFVCLHCGRTKYGVDFT